MFGALFEGRIKHAGLQNVVKTFPSLMGVNRCSRGLFQNRRPRNVFKITAIKIFSDMLHLTVTAYYIDFSKVQYRQKMIMFD
jgi:hypothetical protein